MLAEPGCARGRPSGRRCFGRAARAGTGTPRAALEWPWDASLGEPARLIGAPLLCRAQKMAPLCLFGAGNACGLLASQERPIALQLHPTQDGRLRCPLAAESYSLPQGSTGSGEDDDSSGNIFNGSGLPRGRRTRRSRRCYTSDGGGSAGAGPSLDPVARPARSQHGGGGGGGANPDPAARPIPSQGGATRGRCRPVDASGGRAGGDPSPDPGAQSQQPQNGAMRSCWGAASGRGRGGSGVGGGGGEGGRGDGSRGQADGRRQTGEGLGGSAPAAGGEGFVWPRKGKIGRPRASAPKARPCFAFLGLISNYVACCVSWCFKPVR